jgi:DNA gyrase subunit A
VSDFNDARRLIITEIPYGINKSTLLTQIADGVRAEKLKGISDLRDESDYEGMRIVVTVTRGYKPTKVLEQLLSKTSLKLTYGIIMLALVDGEPEYLSLHRILTLFIKHRLDVIIRRTKHELAQREARLHIVQGLLKALDDIEAVIDTIRRSQSTDTARNNLMKKFDLSEAQANAILNMQLRRLAALERKKLQNERTDLQKRIKYLQALLADEAKRLAVIVEETEDIRQRYATPRQTTLLDLEGENGLVTKADLLRPDDDQMVTASTGGNLSRAEAKGFSWRQSTGVTKRAVDAPLFHLRTAPDAMVILVSNRGRVWYGPVYRIPESTTYAEFGLKEGETIIAADVMTADAYLTLAATNGKVKRTVLSDLGGSEGNWASVMGGLKDSDEVLVAGVTDGSYRVMLFTSHGKAIQFAEEDVNPQASRSAQGVAAISKPKKARLVAGALIQTPANPTDEANRYVLIISEKGWAKRVPLSEFPTQGRAGQGVQTIKADSETGQVATATVAEVGAWASVISGQGRRFYDKVETFEERNRPNKGQFLVDFGADDTIVKVVSL